MKKLLVVGLISGLFSTGAFALGCTATATTSTAMAGTGAIVTGEMCVCNGGAAQTTAYNGGSGNVVATPVFTKSGFIIQCSSNTVVSTNEISGTLFVVAGGSRKGNQTVAGSSAGGAVTASGQCDATGCTGANVTTAIGTVDGS